MQQAGVISFIRQGVKAGGVRARFKHSPNLTPTKIVPSLLKM